MEDYFDMLKMITVITTVVITSFYIYFKYKYTYWSRRGVPCLPPTVPFGNITDVLFMRTSAPELVQDVHMSLKNAGHKFGGLYVFGRPNFIPIDLDLIKTITKREFQSFHDRDAFLFEEVDPLTGHLFSLEGTKWRNLRNKLSPFLTHAKMKMMSKLLLVCGEQLEMIVEESAQLAKCIDVKDIMARFTTDFVGTVAFGLDCNSLKDPDSEFRKHCKIVFDNSFTTCIRNLFLVAAPGLLKFFNISYLTPKVRHFFLDIVKQTVDYRENNQIERKDFLDILIKLRNKHISEEKGEIHLPDTTSTSMENIQQGDPTSTIKETANSEFSFTFDELAAQAFMFIMAGFETSSSAMGFCLYELSLNQEIQDKLRREIRETVKECNGQYMYEDIMEMDYMDKVMKETLRKYPTVAFLSRKCVQEFNVPDSSVVIEKGTGLMISVLGIHRDPQYYPDPLRFDPERFSEENRKFRPPFAFIPFGEGPRNCFGTRFALMQFKMGIAFLIRNYKYTLNEKTPVPVTIDPALPILNPKGGIWMNVEKIID